SCSACSRWRCWNQAALRARRRNERCLVHATEPRSPAPRCCWRARRGPCRKCALTESDSVCAASRSSLSGLFLISPEPRALRSAASAESVKQIYPATRQLRPTCKDIPHSYRAELPASKPEPVLTSAARKLFLQPGDRDGQMRPPPR